MNLNFRQGLISFQSTGGVPQYLQPSATTGYIDLIVSPSAFIGTIAQGSSDYLLKFDAGVPAAWGPLTAGVDNYLYLDLNLITGAVTFGITTLIPIISAIEPSSPITGQMWFDSVSTTFKYRNGTNSTWVVSPRLVVGRVIMGNSNQILPYQTGTSVGLNVPGNPGYVMLDTALRPLRTSSGELLTTDTSVRVVSTVGTSGVLTVPQNNFIPVRANEPIPPMGLVYFSGPDSVSLASSDPSLVILKTPIGVIEAGLAQNDVGVVTQVGEITYDQWNWSPAQIGKPLYCDFNGNLTTTRPLGLVAFRCGWIKNTKSILFYIDSETAPQVYSAQGSLISGEPPITVVTGVNGSGETVSTVSIVAATSTNDGFMTAAQASSLGSFQSQITTNATNITALQSSKMDVGALIPISQVVNLQTTLTGLQSSKTDKVVGAVLNNFAALDASGNLLDSAFSASSFALTAHLHQISDVTGLQTALNNLTTSIGTKISLVSPVTTGDFPALTASGSLADSGFNPASFALTNHTQAMSTITGLAAALNLKMNVGDMIPISQVTNLQTTLNGYEPVIAAGITEQYWRGDKTWQMLNTTALPDFSTAVNAILTPALATKEPVVPAGITAQYYRGDKTWQTLNTSVLPDFSTAVNTLIVAANLEPAIAPGTTAQFWRGDKTWQTVPAGVTTLSALTDVSLTSPADNNLLVYNGAASKWENVPLGQVEVQNI